MKDLKDRVSIILYTGDLEVSNQLYLLAKQAGIDSKINIPEEDNKASLKKAHSRIEEIAKELNNKNTPDKNSPKTFVEMALENINKNK